MIVARRQGHIAAVSEKTRSQVTRAGCANIEPLRITAPGLTATPLGVYQLGEELWGSTDTNMQKTYKTTA